MSTRSAGATWNAVMAVYGYNNDDQRTNVTTSANTLSVVRNQAGLPTSMSVGGLSTFLVRRRVGSRQ